MYKKWERVLSIMMLKFGIQPFWFWNGKMRDDDIQWQIKEMANQGIKGFFIHPRQGLTIPYLSDEWFRKVGIAVDEAKRLKLEVWLYDEYPYPSGVSGGEVLLDHPEFEAKILKRQALDINGNQTIELDLSWGQIVLANAYPIADERIDWEKPISLETCIGTGYKENIFQMSGLTKYNRKRYFTGNPIKKLNWKANKGKWHIEIILQTAIEHFKYFGKYIDPLKREVTEYFIKTTHERYKKYLGHEFGNTIKGIFTDEIAPFPNNLPWSPILPCNFLQLNGYSLNESLPALFTGMTDKSNRVRYDYWNTVTELFIKSFEIPVQNWCKENNLLYIGEKPILRTKQLKYFDVPGIDAGHQKAGSKPLVADASYRANGKIVASAAHFYDKPGALCECFHSIGWGMTLQDMKWIFDWLAIQGINWFIPHAFFYTTDALTKHDAPPSSFYQAPYWRHMFLLAEYTQKITEFLKGRKRKVNILVLDPITSQWTAMGEKYEVGNKLKEDFASLQNILLGNHLDYYVVDPELLGECEIKDKCIRHNGEQFELLILPPILNIEDAALCKLSEYVEKGGKVIATLCLPVEHIGNTSDVAKIFGYWFGIDPVKTYEEYLSGAAREDKSIDDKDLDKKVVFANNIKSVPEAVEELIKRDISVRTNGNEREERDILSAIYERENETYCFLINTSDIKHKVRVELRANPGRFACLTSMPLDTGEKELLRYKQDGQFIYFQLEFSPFQSKLIVFEHEKAAREVQQVCKTVRMAIDLSCDWDITLERMNALRLSLWNLELEGHCMKRSVECQPVIDQVSTAGFHLPIKLKEHFGCPKEIECPSLNCVYQTTVYIDESALNSPVFLTFEPGSIEGEWRIEINDNPLFSEDFQNVEIFLPSNLAKEISCFLKPGNNEIKIKIDTKKTDDGLLNPVYLCGNFSVYKDHVNNNWRITSFQKMGKISEMRANGLPFYAGAIRYSTKMPIDANSIEDVLELYINENNFQDAAELFVNGISAGVRAWSPYKWRVKKTWLKAGINEIEIEISNTLLGLFEGQYFDYHEHRYSEI